MAMRHIRAPLPDTMGRDISTMGFFWEWVPGRIGATTTVGVVIASVDRAEGTITRMADTTRDIHRKAGTHPIIGRRITAVNPHTTADILRITAESLPITEENHRTMVAENRRIMVAIRLTMVVADHRAVEVVVNRQAVAEVEAANLPAEVVAVEVNRRVVVEAATLADDVQFACVGESSGGGA
jgi:hypothetical protein